jgi:hypothetical protein
MSQEHPLLLMYDYYYYCAAGKVALAGGNVYDMDQYRAALASIGWPDYENPQGLTHTPLNMPLYMLMALLPLKISMACWFALNVVGIVFAAYLCRNIFDLKRVPLGFLIFAVATYPPTIKMVTFGQVSLILLLALLGFMVLYKRQQYFWAGFVLSLNIVKPHHLLLLYVLLGIQMVQQRRLILIAGMVTSPVLLALISYLCYPEGFAYYSHAVEHIVSEGTVIRGASLTQWLTRLLPQANIQFLLLGSTLPIIGMLTLFRKISLEVDGLWVIALSIAVSPYIWSHDFVLLFPSFLLFAVYVFRQIPNRAHLVLLPFSFIGIALTSFSNSEPWAVLIPLLILSVTAYTRYSGLLPYWSNFKRETS